MVTQYLLQITLTAKNYENGLVALDDLAFESEFCGTEPLPSSVRESREQGTIDDIDNIDNIDDIDDIDEWVDTEVDEAVDYGLELVPQKSASPLLLWRHAQKKRKRIKDVLSTLRFHSSIFSLILFLLYNSQ